MTQYNRSHRTEVVSHWARLYLRIALGVLIFLHNIGKMQQYNEIISTYPERLGLAGAGWFLLIATLEVLCAVLIIIGWRLRLASTVLLLGSLGVMLFYFNSISRHEIELEAAYSAIYIYIIVVGGGKYSMDSLKKNGDWLKWRGGTKIF